LKKILIALTLMALLLSACSQQLAAVVTPTPEPTSAIEDTGDYLLALLDETDQMAQGILLIQSVLSVDDPDPKTQAELQKGIEAVLDSHSEISDMETPYHLRNLHGLVLDASADCKESARVLAEVLEQRAEDYQAATPFLESCEQQYEILVHALEAALEEHW
jgi:hypothetical protein